MTCDPSPPPVSGDASLAALAQFAQQTGDVLGMVVSTTAAPNVSGMARIRTRSRRAELTVDERVLQLPATAQRTVVAHELGHVATRRAGVTLSLAAIGVAAVGSVVLAVQAPQWALLGWAVTGLAFLGLLLALRQSELAADEWAAQMGWPFDQAHIESLDDAGLLVTPRLEVLSTHPAPQTRLHAMQGAA